LLLKHHDDKLDNLLAGPGVHLAPDSAHDNLKQAAEHVLGARCRFVDCCCRALFDQLENVDEHLVAKGVGVVATVLAECNQACVTSDWQVACDVAVLSVGVDHQCLSDLLEMGCQLVGCLRFAIIWFK